MPADNERKETQETGHGVRCNSVPPPDASTTYPERTEAYPGWDLQGLGGSRIPRLVRG